MPARPSPRARYSTGIAGYDFEGWVGIAVPAATPNRIVARLYRDMASILNSAEAVAWFGEYGAEPRADPPEIFPAAIRTEYERWGRIIKGACAGFPARPAGQISSYNGKVRNSANSSCVLICSKICAARS